MPSDWQLLLQTVLDETAVALFHGDQLISSIIHQSDYQSDNTFVRDIQSCLEGSSIRAEEIQSLTILRGPGTFTGIRTGMVIAKAWLDVVHTPIRSVSTFDYLMGAIPCPTDKTAFIIRASKLDGYVGFFRDGLLVEEKCIRLEEIPFQGSDWIWWTSSIAFKDLPGVRYLNPSPYLPQQYQEITQSEKLLPVYGRSLEELFRTA